MNKNKKLHFLHSGQDVKKDPLKKLRKEDMDGEVDRWMDKLRQ